MRRRGDGIKCSALVTASLCQIIEGEGIGLIHSVNVGHQYQQLVAGGVEHLLGDVGSLVIDCYRVDGSLLGRGEVKGDLLAVDKRPAVFLVGDAVDGKLLLLPVLLVDEDKVAVGHWLQLRTDVGSHLVRAEVDERLRGVAHRGYRNRQPQREQHHNPLDDGSIDARHRFVLQQQVDEHHRAHHIFPERLPVGELNGIAKAATVGHGISSCQEIGEGEHHAHEHEQQQGSGAPEAPGDEHHAKHQFYCWHGKCQEHLTALESGEVECSDILLKLVDAAHGVDGFHKSRDHKRCAHYNAQQYHRNFIEGVAGDFLMDVF